MRVGVRTGSIYTDEQATVYPHGGGFAVECSCGGTIGVSFGIPFDTEGEALAAAHGHVAGHVEDTAAEAELRATKRRVLS